MSYRTKFDLVVSLGHRCYTAIQLRRMMIHGGTMPFDWIVSDGVGVTEAIRSKFAGALAKENLTFRGDRIEDVRYRFDHVHDFPLKSDFLTHYDLAVRRRNEITDRFFKALDSGKSILFIRHELPECASEANARNMIDAIGGHSRGICHLLYLSHKLDKSSSGDRLTFVRTRNTEELTDGEWEMCCPAFTRSGRSKITIRHWLPLCRNGLDR